MANEYRAWQALRYGAATDVLALYRLPTPTPGADEVLLRVHAAALNPIDYKLLAGDLRRVQRLSFPVTPGFDLAGEVIACGPGATRFALGERVYARASRDTLGAFAELSLQPQRYLAPMPANLSYAEAASLPLVALTTVQALVDRAQAQPGQRVLIHAGAGGLGSFAVQYARQLGLVVHATCSSRNAELVRSLGADEVIAYDSDDYRQRRDHYDIVFDTLGGEHTLAAFAVLKQGSTVVSVAGPPDREMQSQAPNALVRLAMRWMARRVYAAAKRRDARYFRFLTVSDGAQLQGLQSWLESGAIRSLIERGYDFERLPAAFAELLRGRARGKIVLQAASGSAR